MTAVVLIQQGLDTRLPLAPGDREATLLGGGRVFVVNPADRCALEWALRLAREVTALALAPPDGADALRLALARGARRAVRLWEPGLDRLDAVATARLLGCALERLRPRLVVAGDRGLTGATGLVPALVAARLGWPCLEGALALAVEHEGRLLATRRAERGAREEVEAPLPAVVTVTADSAEPRYVSLRARRAVAPDTVETWSLTDLDLRVAEVQRWSRAEVVRVDWPRPRARRSPAPPPATAAAERLRQLLAAAGGVAALAGSPQPGRGPGAAPPPGTGAPASGSRLPAPDGTPATAAASGGTAGPAPPGRERRLLRGEPDHLAREIAAFLDTRGLLP